MTSPRCLVLFNYDWDELGFSRWATDFPTDSAGFDLFSFPSNAHLVNFNLQRFVDRLAAKAARAGWQAVTSNHEQFGALAAATAGRAHGLAGNAGQCRARLSAQALCPASAGNRRAGGQYAVCLAALPLR
jgi:hypothetical protein